MDRHGLTLLEVLISIFVVAIGMLSLMALIPVGKHQLAKAGTADRSAAVGTAAWTRIQAAGIFRPWHRRPSVAGATPRSYWTAADGTLLYDTNAPAWSFCVDPIGVAVNGGAVAAFPYSGTGPVMPRITIEPYLTPAARAQLVLRLFTGDDEVQFSAPEGDERTRLVYSVGPDGVWGYPGTDDDGNGTVDDATEAGMAGQHLVDDDGNGIIDDPLEMGDDIPQFAGKYSWMITATPSESYGVTATDAMTYSIQIVVFERRVAQANPTAPVPSERRCFFHAANAIGNDGRLQLDGAGEEYFRDVRVNRWLMLAAEQEPVGAATFPTLFRWYRVAGLGDAKDYDGDGSIDGCDVTLAGPDWSFTDAAGTPLLQDADADATTGLSLHAILVDGVVGVFEKTISVEQVNLWSESVP